MIEARIPDNEQERLLCLRNLKILDTPIEERFERITRMVCRALQVPLAGVSLVDEARQWFKSIQGSRVLETPRKLAFCSHAILKDELMLVPDATLDERFSDNPFVSDSPNIRFYAGQPISLSKDLRLGTLCAMDYRPRELSPYDLQTLRDLGRVVESELAAVALSEEQIRLIQELDQFQKEARIYGLTRLWNRTGIENLLSREWNAALRKGSPIALVMVDFDDFKKINDTHGHPVGDEVIRNGSHLLLTSLRSYDAVGRWGGDEFLIVLPGCTKEETMMTLNRIQSHIASNPLPTAAGPIKITLSMGATSVIPKHGDTLEQLIKKADDELLKAKRNGKGHSEIAV